MSASTAQKAVAIIALVLVGLPTGLCSVAASPFVVGMFVMAAKGGADALGLGVFYAFLWLIGFAITYLLIRWVIWAFRRRPGGTNNGNPGTSS